MTVALLASSAVTVKVDWLGHRAGRALTTKCVAVWVCVLTTIALLAPVMLAVTVSVAVIVWLPLVTKVALKTPTPLVNVPGAGTVPAPSLVVNATVPA